MVLGSSVHIPGWPLQLEGLERFSLQASVSNKNAVGVKKEEERLTHLIVILYPHAERVDQDGEEDPLLEVLVFYQQLDTPPGRGTPGVHALEGARPRVAAAAATRARLVATRPVHGRPLET